MVKGVGGIFEVATEAGVLACHARKKIRHQDNELLIGDDVAVESLAKNKGTIEEVLPRRNRLTRPVVANVDQVVIVTAPMPPADFSLADKILINCQKENIRVLLAVNKCEAASQHFFDRINANYKGLTEDIMIVSAHKNIGISALAGQLKGKITCFAGQSGVGKTSLLNIIAPEYKGETGDISARILRGKNTTRHTQLLPLPDGGYVVDTPGFSLLELADIESASLTLYYGDFAEFSPQCKYKMCTHTAEPGCAVKKAVQEGGLSAERYERYAAIFKELKEIEKARY